MKYIFAILAALILSFPAHAADINQMRVIHSNGSFALATPIYTNPRALAANVAESFTVPPGANGQLANYVNFSAPGCNFHANYTTTATVPGDVTNGSASEANPLTREISDSTTTISVISSTACIVTASFYM